MKGGLDRVTPGEDNKKQMYERRKCYEGLSSSLALLAFTYFFGLFVPSLVHPRMLEGEADWWARPLVSGTVRSHIPYFNDTRVTYGLGCGLGSVQT